MAAPIRCSHQCPPIAGTESLQHVLHRMEREMTQVVKKGSNKKLGQTGGGQGSLRQVLLTYNQPLLPSSSLPLPQPFLTKFCTVPCSPSNIPNPRLPPASPSYQLQTPGFSSPKLSLSVLGGPSIGDWRFLVFGIISLRPCLPGLCLRALLFIPSPFAQERSSIG